MQTLQLSSEHLLDGVRALEIYGVFRVVLAAVVAHAPQVSTKYVFGAVKAGVQARFNGAEVDGIGDDGQVVGDNTGVDGLFKWPRMLALRPRGVT